MADQVFILRTRAGRVIFTLKFEVLEISSKRLGQLQTWQVPLRSISPKYVRVVRRVPLGALLPVFGIVALLFLGYYLLIRQDVVPRELAMYPALFGVAALWGVTRLLRRFDC